MATKMKSTLDRRAVIRQLMAPRAQDENAALMVAGLGSSAYDMGTMDDPKNFYLWGGMGGAAMIGLGIALAQPKRRVVVVTGDGEMLMGLGSLATIGAEKVRNLSIVVMDNELYSETGMQPTHTARGVDLAGIARAAGFADTGTVHNESGLNTWIPRLYKTPGPLFLAIKLNANRYPLSIRLRDGVHIKNRFREALLGSKAFD